MLRHRLCTVLAAFCCVWIFPVAAYDTEDCCCWECGDFTLMGDVDMSMIVGAENIHSAYRLYECLDDKLWKPDCYYSPGFFGGLLRGAKLLLIDFPMANMALLGQHEFFGHGARLREFDIGQSYSFEAPFPYGWGGAATSFSAARYAALRPLERSAINTGGVESTELLGRAIVKRALCQECVDYREALLFFLTYHDQTGYVFSLTDELSDDDGHDISSYVNEVNDYCGRDDLSKGELKSLAWINFVDASTWILGRAINCFFSDGQTCGELSTLCLFDVKLLPGLRLTLAPYGPEVGVNTFFKTPCTLGYAYARWGNNCGMTSYAAGIDIDNIWECDCFTLGVKGDVWKQPRIFNLTPGSTSFGSSVTLRGIYQVGDSWSLLAEIGAKSRGFVPGEPLDGALIARAGITFLCF